MSSKACYPRTWHVNDPRRTSTRGSFFESPDITNGFGMLQLHVYIQNQGLNKFADNFLKLSVNKTKCTGFLACLL